MTRVQTELRRSRSLPQIPADGRREAEALLRDAAFVLQMTRRVRDAITADRPQPKARPAEELMAAAC